jgi:hypothetical protein
MKNIPNFPYFEVQFNKEGKVNDPSEAQKILDFLNQQAITDLIAISHGWNTDMDDARKLYQEFFETMSRIIDGGNISGVGTRKFAVLAVLWPSKKFAEKNLIAGGAASSNSPEVATIKEQLTILKELIADPKTATVFAELTNLIPKLEDSPKSRKTFVDQVRSLLVKKAVNEEDASVEFFKLKSEELMERLSQPILSQPVAGEGGGAAEIGDLTSQSGGAAGLLDFGGFTAAAEKLLNFATYFEMKQRSGTVGQTGLNPLLQKIRTQNPALKLHLIGHSFGGRLVSAAALGTGGMPPLKIETMSLLQAAFSHHGFANNFEGDKDGFFRKVVKNKGVSGPILITHTKNDQAVGIAYPIASAIAQDDAAGLGDENDRFGGIGRNGAQKTPEAVNLALLPVDGTYQFEMGKLHNLLADNFIKDHGDICKPEVAYAILTALVMT